MTGAAILPSLIERFFTQRLMQQRNASPHTIASYRDTFRLLFAFAQVRLGKPPSRLDLADLDAPFISAFLDDLEASRAIGTRTRNLRLTAIRAFFRFAALEEPAYSGQIQRVLTIPGKLHDKREVHFLTRGEIDGERVAWAIPLFDLRPDQFVPLDRRAKDPARASRLLRIAEEQLKKARKGGLWNGMVSGELFQMALVEDISNPDIYYKIGMIERIVA